MRRRLLGPRHPDTAGLEYNLACTLALAGRRDEAIATLRGALEHGLGARSAAAIDQDDDFKSLHGDAGFEALVAAGKGRGNR